MYIAEQFVDGGGSGGCFGAPPIVEQAPGIWCCEAPPQAAITCRPIGTRVNSVRPITRVITDRIPVSAAGVGDHVTTVSKQSGENPAPIPPVGVISPQKSYTVPEISAAPKTRMWGGLALFAGIVIALWIFAGASLRRFI
jgi:hypothetical protein